MLVLLAILSLTMMAQVIARYIFGSPFSWAEELCRYCFVYTGALSAGYCIRRGALIRVDLIINLLPKPLKISLDYMGKILVTVMYGYLAYKSLGLISITTTVSSAMQIPMKAVYAALPIGLTIGTLRGIQDLYRFSMSLSKGGAK